VDALNAKGAPFSMEDDSLLAVCIQHEVDHLNGKLFVDYLSTLKRSRIRSKLEKNQRSHTL
jgi:peptide deformylase